MKAKRPENKLDLPKTLAKLATHNPQSNRRVNISKAQLHSLLASAEAQQEENTIRLAREIHDDVSQQLTALTIELSLLERRLGKNKEAAKVHELLELVGSVSRSVKRTMNDLRPKILDEFGLMPALKYECQRLSDLSGRKISFSFASEDLALPPAQASQIFRMMQKVLGHVLRWEKTSNIQVEGSLQSMHLHLKVKSDGHDFHSEYNQNIESLWRLHLQETVRRLGGQMTFASGKQHGQKIGFKIPLDKSERTK